MTVPTLIEPDAVLAAVKDAARRLTPVPPHSRRASLTAAARGALPEGRSGRRNGPQPNKETAFTQSRPPAFSPLFSSSRKRTNPLDTCGAIKERRTAFPAPNKEL
jgi:hypothetical protein